MRPSNSKCVPNHSPLFSDRAPQSELTFADQKKVPIVPMIAEPQYQVSGVV